MSPIHPTPPEAGARPRPSSPESGAPVRPSSDDAALWAGLFARYPFKSAQRFRQGLDSEKLAAFFARGLLRRIESGATILGVESGGEPIALGGLAEEAWRAPIFGLRTARFEPWLNFLDPPRGVSLLRALLDEARRAGLEHLAVRLDGDDFANLHLFESAGFRLVDVSLKYSRSMPKPHPDRPLRDDGWSIRLSTPADRDWLVDLGSRVHPQNHYFNDPWIDPERVRALFGAWMRRCVDGLAYRIYVLESPQGRPAGFVTYLRSPAFAEAVGRRPLILDYVILEPEARGEGRGSRLIGRTLAMESGSGFDYCELRTSQNNYAAAASYEKLGFRLCSTDFALHHLLSDGSDPSEPSRKAQRI